MFLVLWFGTHPDFEEIQILYRDSLSTCKGVGGKIKPTTAIYYDSSKHKSMREIKFECTVTTFNHRGYWLANAFP